jgi:hypothetical protein
MMTLEDLEDRLIACRRRRVALVRDLRATPLSVCRSAADEIEALDRDLSLAEQCIARMEANVLEAAERAVSE